jgi:hypothetical protein
MSDDEDDGMTVDEHVDAVLEDPDWTRRVVFAAHFAVHAAMLVREHSDDVRLLAHDFALLKLAVALGGEELIDGMQEMQRMLERLAHERRN